MSGWQTTLLPEPRLAEAWPLLRLRYPEFTLDSWLGESLSLLSDAPQGGVVAVQTQSGYIYAVCAFVVEPCDHVGGQSLHIPFVANVPWHRTDDPLVHLLRQLETIAEATRCDCLSTPGDKVAGVNETSRWEAAGYEWIGTSLRKRLYAAGLRDTREI